MFPATLFDYNGVLADDESVHLEAFREALVPLGIAISEEAYVDRYLGFDDRGAFRAILEDHGRPAPESEVERLVELKRPLYRARALRGLPTFPGARSILERRARAGPVGIVSGALKEEIELGLQALGATSQVSFIVSADETEAGKPSPEGYLIGIRRLGERIGEAQAQRALVIEDSLSGVQAARAAGLFSVALPHSYPPEALLRAGAHLVVDDLDALTEDLLASAYRSFHG